MDPLHSQLAQSAPNRLVTTVRWLGVLPVAAASGYFTWLGITLLNRLTFAMQGLDPDAFLSRAFIEAASNGTMGAAIVYAGAKMAPAHRRIVVFVLAVLALVGAGFLLFPALVAGSGWAIYGIAWWIIGAGAVAWSVYSGEATEFDD